MLGKLDKICIRGKLFTFFDNYFMIRTLKVSIGKMSSNEYNQHCTLIQGSVVVLSPTLFNLYVNDLANSKITWKIIKKLVKYKRSKIRWK